MQSTTISPPPKMNRRGFGLKEEIQGDLARDYHSAIVDKLRQNANNWVEKGVSFHLAESFGFCYGVDRAVELAYETRRNFPNKTIYLTTEIIHNPTVNQNLENMGIRFLRNYHSGGETAIDAVTAEDVVIIPAFGTDIYTLDRLSKTGCTLVDTICGSVLVVWKRVESYARDGFTAIIHGRYNHEETIATSSRLKQFDHGRYLVVFNKEEAQIVCTYMVDGGDKQAFLDRFRHVCSENFDPDLDLQKIGLANQTTMLSSESLEIAQMFRKAVERRDRGDVSAFRTFDTICSATQDRQNAVMKLLEQRPDLMVVIGGYNSSNTSHLSEIASYQVPTYHIDRAACMISANQISHRPFGKTEDTLSPDWLPKEEVRIGITAGASTPNQVIGEVIERILSFR